MNKIPNQAILTVDDSFSGSENCLNTDMAIQIEIEERLS